MATTDVMQTDDYTKHSPLTHTSCSLIHNTTEHKQIIISQNNATKQQQQEETPKKKYWFKEVESMREARTHSLSHWPHATPSKELMAASGWFSCNVSDRVICIYCDTICHEWSANDDPAQVHSRLAPQCPFVLSLPSNESSEKIINNNLTEKFEPTHPAMAEISRREKTFSSTNWSENTPSVEELVRAGFFCSGVTNTVTCFYCNGSLHKWGPKDNPMIEHARWFPHCVYAKHLCGNRLYDQIQASKRRVLPENKISTEELSRLVAARLDLPIVGRLRLKYQIAIIKRCLEDQLRIKNDDFISDIDFTMACQILQKQIDIIKGCKDKIITPSKTEESEDSTSSFKQSLGECFICLTEEKQLACMPCGHLCACVPCGYALKTCPICREKIQSFVRINT